MERERLSHLNYAQFLEQFERLEPGQSFKYHLGALAPDRLLNIDLDKLAERALELGTSIGDETRPIDGTTGIRPAKIRVGQGKAILYQKLNCIGHEYFIAKLQLPF